MSVWRFSPRGPRVARRPRGRLAGVLLWALAWAAAGVVPPRALGAASLPSRQETGATVATYDDRTHQYVFRGPQVVVTRGADRLEAPEVLYNAAREQVVLPQRGRVSTPTLVVEADRIAADLAARHLVADGDVVARLLERGRWAVLTAARVEVDDRPGARRAVAQGAVRLVRGDEELTGSRVAYDLEARRAVVEGRAVLVRGGDRLEADSVLADLGRRVAEARGHVTVVVPEQGLRATAERALYDEQARSATLTGHVTLWRGRDVLTAERVTLLLREHLVRAEGNPELTVAAQEAAP